MEKIRIAIVGAGSRGADCYGQALLEMKDRAQMVAVAEPRADRRNAMADAHGVPEGNRFETGEELLARPKLADAMLICTQDRQHVRQAVAAMRLGYDLLMEKPISPVAEELREIVRVQRETGRKVVVCHVLRYTPFYCKIKQVIDSGAIGEVVAIQALENVQYWHQAHSFVRGNWRNAGLSSPMIMQKCCHDLDYLVWLSGQRCERVTSFGSLKHFRPECAPAGAAMRCTAGCAAKESCPYDAEKIYLTNPNTGVLSGAKGWPCDVLALNPTEESIRAAIETGPYGRCVYHCDNDVVDHQVVDMLMENSSTLTLTMSAFTSVGGRSICVMGTRGDIRGDLEANTIRIGPFGQPAETVDVRTLSDDFSGHAGGDKQLLRQFLDLLSGKEADGNMSTLEASVESHLVALAAEESRLNGGQSIEIAPMRG